MRLWRVVQGEPREGFIKSVFIQRVLAKGIYFQGALYENVFIQDILYHGE